MRRFPALIDIVVVLVCLEPVATGQALPVERVLSHREQASAQYRWISTRLESLLPSLMRREDIETQFYLIR